MILLLVAFNTRSMSRRPLALSGHINNAFLNLRLTRFVSRLQHEGVLFTGII